VGNDKELRKQAGGPKARISFQTKPDIALGQIRSLVNEDVPRGVVWLMPPMATTTAFAKGSCHWSSATLLAFESSTRLWPPGIVPLPPNRRAKWVVDLPDYCEERNNISHSC